MKVVALAGGVGGAKLADGLARILSPQDLTIIVNTGDDFEHWGLNVCPDLDSVCYMLAGFNNTVTGWGRADESWNAFEEIKKLGGDDWFRIGDKDLATHLMRSGRLRQGVRLSQVTAELCNRWQIRPAVLPMTDDPVYTWVQTVEHGLLPFQQYFVQHGCRPRVSGFEFRGAQDSKPAPGVIMAIDEADMIAVCPSNPMVSIGPILAVPGILDALRRKKWVVAVSPLINGKAVKGPAAKMYEELGMQPSSLEVAKHYRGWVHHIFIDAVDQDLAGSIRALGLDVSVGNIMMSAAEDRIRLAELVLNTVPNTLSGLS